MTQKSYPENWPDIDHTLYNRSVQLLRAVKSLLSVKFALHADSQLMQGDIFLFNHFSRFETFIPQFLIFEHTGAYSCAIASSEFFVEDNFLANYLKHVGVFPHDHPRLFAMLAEHIMRGRKVIIFPEGGMVKDRRVIDKKGKYSIYSRIKGIRRKHHTGPAILGQGVEAMKAAIRHAFNNNLEERLQQWQEALKLDSPDELMAAALKPTLLIPANITFYPIRSSENLLFKSVDMFSNGLNQRQSEELLIEGNILLKNTDMDIRLGKPVNPCCDWDWRTHFLMDRVAPNIQITDQVFTLNTRPRNWKERLLSHYFIKNAKCSRNRYMRIMYANVTVNLSHLASTLIMSFIAAKRTHIEESHFYTVLYIAIKNLQKNPDIHLHDSLLNPDDYGDLRFGVNVRFEQFICIAKELELITVQDGCYYFSHKLCADYDQDRIRLENPIAVYNNEAAPVPMIRQTLQKADRDYHKISPYQLAAWHFEDEQLGFNFELQEYSSPENNEIHLKETAIADHTPFFITPKKPNGFGILLIHGLLASPAELREYGHYLADQGYTVLGVRLKGHGTSPYALRDLSFEEWMASVKRGLNILKLHCPKLFVIGFSTGGALALKLAAEFPDEISAVVAVSVPIKFVNPAFMLIPLLHNTNSLVHWVSSFEGVKPFIENTPEHPDINYRNVPVRALYELRRLIQHLNALLPDIEAPALLLYGDRDPVVDPRSADTVFSKLGSQNKQMKTISSERHGILMENLGDVWPQIDEFLSHCQHAKNDMPVEPLPFSNQEVAS